MEILFSWFNASYCLKKKIKFFAANYANSHEFFFQSAKISAIRGKAP